MNILYYGIKWAIMTKFYDAKKEYKVTETLDKSEIFGLNLTERTTATLIEC